MSSEIDNLQDEITSLYDQKRQSIQSYNAKLAPLEETLNVLLVNEYIQTNHLPPLLVGNALVITAEFHHEKKRLGVSNHFIGRFWAVGRPVTIQALTAHGDNVTVIIKGKYGAGTTGVDYMTALDMRKAAHELA